MSDEIIYGSMFASLDDLFYLKEDHEDWKHYDKITTKMKSNID